MFMTFTSADETDRDDADCQSKNSFPTINL